MCKLKIHNYGDLIVLEYDNAEWRERRHLTSKEYEQLRNWLFSQFSRMNSYAVRDPEQLRYELEEKIIGKTYWEDISSAKSFVSMLLKDYVGQFKSLPDVQIKEPNSSSKTTTKMS